VRPVPCNASSNQHISRFVFIYLPFLQLDDNVPDRFCFSLTSWPVCTASKSSKCYPFRYGVLCCRSYCYNDICIFYSFNERSDREVSIPVSFCLYNQYNSLFFSVHILFLDSRNFFVAKSRGYFKGAIRRSLSRSLSSSVNVIPS